MRRKSSCGSIISLFQEKERNERKDKEKCDRVVLKGVEKVYEAMKVEKCLKRMVKGLKMSEGSKRKERRSLMGDARKKEKGEEARKRDYVPFPEEFRENAWMRGIEDRRPLKRKALTKKAPEEKMGLIYCHESTLRNAIEMNGKVILKCIVNVQHMKIAGKAKGEVFRDFRPLNLWKNERPYREMAAQSFNQLNAISPPNQKCKWEKVVKADKNYSKLNLVDCSSNDLSQYCTVYEKILKRTQNINQLRLITSVDTFITVNDIIKHHSLFKERKLEQFISMPHLSLCYLSLPNSTTSYEKKPNNTLHFIQCDTTTSLSVINSKKFKQKTSDILVSLSSSFKPQLSHKLPFALLHLNKEALCKASKKYCEIQSISFSQLIKKRSYNEITPSVVAPFFLIKPSLAKYLKKKQGGIAVDMKESVHLIFDLDSCGIVLDIEQLIDEYDSSAYAKAFDIINKNYLRFASFYILLTELKPLKRNSNDKALKLKVEDYLNQEFSQVMNSTSIRLRFIVTCIKNINELFEHIVSILNDIRLDKGEHYSLFKMPSVTSIQALLKQTPSQEDIKNASGTYPFLNTFEAIVLWITKPTEEIHSELKHIIQKV